MKKWMQEDTGGCSKGKSPIRVWKFEFVCGHHRCRGENTTQNSVIMITVLMLRGIIRIVPGSRRHLVFQFGDYVWMRQQGEGLYISFETRRNVRRKQPAGSMRVLLFS